MSVIDEKKIAEVTEKLAKASENSAIIYESGLEAGKKSEYDAFWDTFQKNGSRRYYERAFEDTANGGQRWVYGATYRPKHPMKPLSAISMYAYGALPYEAIAAVDFSECTDLYSTFSYFTIRGDAEKKFPPIDVSSATRTQNMFGWVSGIYEIEKITVKRSSVLSSMFNGATSIREVRFEGEIGSSFGLSTCTNLSRESIENIIEHLSNSTTGLKVTFSRAAVNKAFETTEGANDGESSGDWSALVATKSTNWTIALA